MKKRNLLFSLVTAIAMMMLCPQGALAVINMPKEGTITVTLAANETIQIYDDGGADNNYSDYCDGTINLTAPEGYAIKITGTCVAEGYGYDELLINGTQYDYDGWDYENDCPAAVAIDQTTSNNCSIRFYSDGSNYAGFALTATAVPFLSNFAYTTEKQTDGTYKVDFTFVNKDETAEYTVNEGTDGVGTIKNGAATLQLTSVSKGIHTYTFTDGTTSVDVVCELGVCLIPDTGTKEVELTAGETINIYDDGGADNNYSNKCDGTVNLTAPEGYAIKITGTCVAEGSKCDELLINGTQYDYDGWDDYDDCPKVVAIDQTTGNNCTIRFYSDESSNYAGFTLTATAVSFLSNFAYTTEKQTDGTYNVDFTFVNKNKSVEYTVNEGTAEVGTIKNEAATLQLTGVSKGVHTYTFTDGATSVDVVCELGAYLIPQTGTKEVELTAGESLVIYDDGGADNNYSKNCDGTINLTAPEGYVIKITGTCVAEGGDCDELLINGTQYDYDGWDDDNNCPAAVAIDQTTGNNCTIRFSSDGSVNYAGFALTATAVPFLGNIAYTTEKQTDGRYKVDFTFVNNDVSAEYTVNEGTNEVGTINNGATTLQLTGVSKGVHTYTFTDGAINVDVVCEVGVYLIPKTGTKEVKLTAGETINIYDDGGADNNYSYECDGKINLTAPEGCVIKITGTLVSEGYPDGTYYDYLTINGTDYYSVGNGSMPTVNIECTSSSNTSVLKFVSDDDENEQGFALTATAVPYSPIVTLNTAGYATYSSDVDFVVATEGVKAYTATVSDDKITLTAVGDGEYIPAGTGVILYGDGKANTNVLFQAPDNSYSAETNDNALAPTTFEDGTLAEVTTYSYDSTNNWWTSVWALGDGASMLHFSGTAFIPNRAYFFYDRGPKEAKAMTLVFADDIATGIEAVHSAEFTVQSSAAYNLAGQRVNNSAKGFVIKNGKKYYNK